MNSVEKEISKSFLKLNIPFGDYGITSSDDIFYEGIFSYPEFPILAHIIFGLHNELKC